MEKIMILGIVLISIVIGMCLGFLVSDVDTRLTKQNCEDQYQKQSQDNIVNDIAILQEYGNITVQCAPQGVRLGDK